MKHTFVASISSIVASIGAFFIKMVETYVAVVKTESVSGWNKIAFSNINNNKAYLFSGKKKSCSICEIQLVQDARRLLKSYLLFDRIYHWTLLHYKLLKFHKNDILLLHCEIYFRYFFLRCLMQQSKWVEGKTFEIIFMILGYRS